MNEEYGSIERFKFAANSKPLSVKEITPRDLVIKDVNPPLLGFTLINDINSNIDKFNDVNESRNAFILLRNMLKTLLLFYDILIFQD